MNIKELLEKGFKDGLSVLTSQQKDQTAIDDNYNEFVNLSRTVRDTQVGFTQKEKTVGTGNDTKLISPTRIIVNYQKEIVSKSVAFEVGNPPTIEPNEQNDLSDLVLKNWKDLRMDSKLQEGLTIQKSQTEFAFMFHFQTKSDKTRAIKCKVLSHKTGVMSAHFDEFGDMDSFVWEFMTTVNKKEIKNIWVFDDINVYKYSDLKGDITVSLVVEPHGFTKIPIVYGSQMYNEWFDVERLIDRYETSLSRLVESNDYSGHPILALFGKVQSMPDKENSGKTLNFPIETTIDGKPVQGDAKFITHDDAPESVKMELETEDELIYSITQTPKISFSNLKGIGAVSGVALEFMFLDAILKAKSNEGSNRTMIERCLNLITDGITNTLNVGLKNQSVNLSWNIRFNSIIPKDLSGLITDMATGVEKGIISTESAVKRMSLTQDSANEIELIKASKTNIL